MFYNELFASIHKLFFACLHNLVVIEFGCRLHHFFCCLDKAVRFIVGHCFARRSFCLCEAKRPWQFQPGCHTSDPHTLFSKPCQSCQFVTRTAVQGVLVSLEPVLMFCTPGLFSFSVNPLNLILLYYNLCPLLLYLSPHKRWAKNRWATSHSPFLPTMWVLPQCRPFSATIRFLLQCQLVSIFPPFQFFQQLQYLTRWLLVVVYFDQQTGAPHAVCWLK